MRRLSPLEERFAQRVTRAREARGISQQNLADRVGIGRAAVSEIESGRRKASLREAVEIADVLGVPLAELHGTGLMTLTVRLDP